MKKLISLSLIIASTLFVSSCFQKQREPIEDDGTGVSLASKWDWSGTAPLSAKLNNRNIELGQTFVVEKVVSNQLGLYYMLVQVKNGTVDDGTYTIILENKLNPGIHVSMGSTSSTNFNMIYTPFQEPLPGRSMYTYSTEKLVLKLIRNDEQVAEGYFYGRLKDLIHTNEPPVNVKQGYFYIEKKGAIVQG